MERIIPLHEIQELLCLGLQLQVALMLQADKDIRSADVKSILIESARNDDNTGDLSDTASTMWGWGKVDAFSALKKVEELKGGNVNVEPFTLYPNPTNEQLYYAGELDKIYVIELIAINGRSVMIREIGRFKPIDVSSLASGLYFVKIDSQMTHLKVMIE